MERFARYYADPPMRGKITSSRVVPFFQALASITASGKTVILADAVAGISAALPVAPVVLWLSMGRVVVEQSLANLSAGGKYHHLLGETNVATLAEYDPEIVRGATSASLFFATVGTFNQRDKERGDRLIFKCDIDTAESSTWDLLKVRLNSEDVRRPLIIVYDEGHNLSDQQTSLLLELQPDAFLVASATMRLPSRLSDEINELKKEGWSDEDLVTAIEPTAVVEAGLIKSTVLLAGYEAPMEETVSAMLADMRDAAAQAKLLKLESPKAIYVCKTNIVEGDAQRTDDPKRPFVAREAPPILIWRYLVETCKVDPAKVAVYCSLKFDRQFPPPVEFNLFSGGEKDYVNFAEGDYEHVIFNLSLQEGWDDPRCYFAYVDKSMESNVAIEQVIGRLLRQPGAQHYTAERLNTAHFYVRVDKRNVFSEILSAVALKLKAEAPEVRLMASGPGKAAVTSLEPRERGYIYKTAIDASYAAEPISKIMKTLADYRKDDGRNTRATGGRSIVQRAVGETTSGQPELVWEDFEHTNQVSARWVFCREVGRRFQGALGVAMTHEGKFDALVGFGSPAYANVVRVAADVVDAYVDNVVLKQQKPNPYEVGAMFVRADSLETFENSLHDGYSDLNPSLELPFARALDGFGLPWCRNPSRSGYGIPLITMGKTRTFYPDFLVWSGDHVFALDTTASHLLADKTSRKLLSIRPVRNVAGQLWVRFISQGKFENEVTQVDTEGFTVWGLKQDGTLRRSHVDTMHDAIQRALTPEL
ncbi:hypothetical protein [Microbispora sp. CSR-4]|uniref:hypothetical protein n=1 Tax=Microbispora sp. CSR-4 TaxID=2592813 RepID=UPI001C9BCC0E|nr:hypothetical protein [Microbispora sp. CSR-4]